MASEPSSAKIAQQKPAARDSAKPQLPDWRLNRRTQRCRAR
ncbi:hypothetical protein XCR_1333 [Xanthomonas campestris pv. raphani 756C]|nr:hypothetical protein XCR_1333 [Xanthomonas campestris pv. raphani 756C]